MRKDTERLLASFGQIKDDTFDFELIKKYFMAKDHSECFQVISDKTCNDLDFDEFFMYVDRTSSKTGQQYLYHKLRTIPATGDKTEAEEALIQNLSTDPEFRVSVQRQLEKLGKTDALYIPTLFQEDHLKPPKWFFLVRILSFTSLFTLLLLPFNPALFFVLLFVFMINLGVHYWNKKNLYQYLNALPQLLKLSIIARELFKNDQFKSLCPSLPDSIKAIDKVRRRMAFFKLETKLEGDFEALFWAILELFKTLFLLEPILLFGVLRHLDSKRIEIEEVYTFVGRIDAFISIASLRHGLNEFCIPEIHSSQTRIIAKGIRHPLIPECVANSITVDGKSILLTGSNMSGKTSFIRTIGLNVIAGLTIHTCFAREMAMPRLQVLSAIRISDDLLNDKSYYFEEVLTIRDMIRHGLNGKPGLFLLDEIFKGTNTIERISAGKAVLSALSKNGNIVFVSTHDIELADLLKYEYELYHFSEVVNDKKVDFDYKLKNGKLKNRNAIRILQINDYPESIIQEALDISRKLDMRSRIRE